MTAFRWEVDPLTRQVRARPDYGKAGPGLVGPPASEAGMVDDLGAQMQPRSGLLPPVVRWYSKARRWWLLERPPALTVIEYRHGNQEESEAGQARAYLFELPIPWTVLLVHLTTTNLPDDVSLFATTGPISAESVIGLLPLPNLYDFGGVCLPPGVARFGPCHNAAAGLTLALQLTWEGGFNLDLQQAVLAVCSSGQPAPLLAAIGDERRRGSSSLVARLLKAWQGFSLEQVLTWHWPSGAALLDAKGYESHYTVAGLMELAQTLEDEGAGSTALRLAYQGAYSRNVS